MYGIKGSRRKWFEIYLTNRKQYVQINKQTETDFQDLTFWVPQGSILGPLQFLIYVNDLLYVLNLLESIIILNDTNLLSAERKIKELFKTMNNEFQKISQWLISNKVSLNVAKNKYSFFHKPSKKDNFP